MKLFRESGKLHHPSVLVAEDVAVEHKVTMKIFEPVSDYHVTGVCGRTVLVPYHAWIIPL